MTRAGIGGLPGPTRVKRLKGNPTADDSVKRKFHRSRVNELSGRIVGYSIADRMKARIAVDALNNAASRRGNVTGQNRPQPRLAHY